MMDLRNFGTRSGLSVPPANIGAMRLPQDLGEAVALIRHAIDSGMRYIDTSRGYGDSEFKLGHALRDGYREKVILSTKWSPWVTKIQPDDDASADCVRRRIDEQLRRLDVDYLDFYQVWNIHTRETYDEATRRGGMVDGILKAKAEGLVAHTGFTTHDSVENLLSYMDEIDWCEVLLVSYNLMNRTYEPVLEAAHARGIGTIVMNPVGGGKLAQESRVLAKLAKDVGAASVPELAIRYILSNPNVTTLITGMTRTSDVDDTVAAAAAGAFTTDQLDYLNAFTERVTRENAGFCTRCKYCLPCEHGIDIPAVMSAIYEARYWGLVDAGQAIYDRISGAKADACDACGKCEERCTQQLRISEEMAYARKKFGKAKRAGA